MDVPRNSSFLSGIELLNASRFGSPTGGEDRPLPQLILSSPQEKKDKPAKPGDLKEIYINAEIEVKLRQTRDEAAEEAHQQRLKSIEANLEEAKKDDWMFTTPNFCNEKY